MENKRFLTHIILRGDGEERKLRKCFVHVAFFTAVESDGPFYDGFSEYSCFTKEDVETKSARWVLGNPVIKPTQAVWLFKGNYWVADRENPAKDSKKFEIEVEEA